MRNKNTRLPTSRMYFGPSQLGMASIVKTYPDSGKSGVVAKNRTGLSDLLKDVTSGNAKYKAILVYDVSRWGRYPNNDEAAHYEFLCLKAGIPLHYCAEQFVNDGTAISAILKSLKRSMASEFSRELGEKVILGKIRLVQMGFWMGGPPGYGFRRLTVSASGKRKLLMKTGELRNLKTDRVVLVLGPRKEVQTVRAMFSLAAKGKGCSEIAHTLNQAGMKRNEKAWRHEDIKYIVSNLVYTGCAVWNRLSTRLNYGSRGPAPFLR